MQYYCSWKAGLIGVDGTALLAQDEEDGGEDEKSDADDGNKDVLADDGATVVHGGIILSFFLFFFLKKRKWEIDVYIKGSIKRKLFCWMKGDQFVYELVRGLGFQLELFIRVG